MEMQFFANALSEICAHSLVAPGRLLRWIIIANPTAGGFTIRSRWKKCRKILEEYLEAAGKNPLRDNCAPAAAATEFALGSELAFNGLILTDGQGAATRMADALVKEAEAAFFAMPHDAKTDEKPFYLVITAGGDGTSLEVLSVLYNTLESIRSNMAILRLPMGTGNDGADSADLAKTLDLLIKPSRTELVPALRLQTAQHGSAVLNGPFLAFNVLSVGLDAFVTHMTNKMKGKLPGDFYKLWVDIAALLYDRLYKVGFLDVVARDDQGKKIQSFRDKILLLAVGVSGHRTYGSQKKILPDDRNVCAVKQMSLFRKIALKGLFTTGEHIHKPESNLFNACRIEFSGEHPILAQMDGETVLLQQGDFPASIELTDPAIPILKLL